MQILQKQTVFVPLGDLEQKRGEKTLAPGKLVIAENVRQDKTKVYSKRDGYLRMDQLTDTGTFTTGDLGTTGDALVVKGPDAVWLRSSDAAEWLNRGPMNQVMPSISEISPEAGRRPTHVVNGAQIWTFWGSSADRWYSVTELNTHIVIQPPTKFSTGTAGGVSQMRAVVAGGSVWCFYWISTGNSVLLAKFNPATPAAAPTQTTYANVTAGTMEAWDIVGSNSGVLFACVGTPTIAGVAAGFHVSKLDTATGLPTGAGWVTSGASGTYSGPAAFLTHATGNPGGSAFFVSRVSATSAINHFDIVTATLVTTSTNIGTGGISLPSRASMTGTRLSNGDKLIVTTDGTGTAENALTHKRVYVSGGAHTASVLRRGMYTVSSPWQRSGVTYILMGTEDGQRLQRSYQVIDASTGTICGRTLYQRGGDIWLRAMHIAGSDRWDYGHITQSTLSGSNAIVAVNNAFTPDPTGPVVQPYGVKLLTWDLSPYLGPPVTANGQCFMPGGFPQSILGESTLAEPAPAAYPPFGGSSLVGAGGSLLIGNYSTLIVYAFRDPSGNVYRSAPCPPQAIAVGVNNSRIDYTLRTLRMTNSSITCLIEIYLTGLNSTTLRLHTTVLNDTSVDTIAATITSVPAADAEIVYVDGGVLSNIAPPPCRWAAAWRERLFVGDTDEEGAVWASQTFVSGFGPSWNEVLRFHIRDGSGRVYAGAAVDQNSFALFKADGIWTISGPGPDRQGRGNYQPLRVEGAPGCTNPRSVVTTPLGVMYQGAENTGIWLLTPSRQSVYIGAGVDEHKATAVLGAVLHSYQKRIVFATAGVRNLVFDYGNPLPEEGSVGRWYTEVPSNASAWSGGQALVVQGAGLYMATDDGIEQQVEEQWNDNGQPIVQRAKFAPIQLPGILNYQRLYRGQLLAEWRGNHGLVLTVETDYGAAKGGASETFPTKTVTAAGSPIYEFRPVTNKKPVAIAVEVTETGGHLTEGFTIEGIALEIGVKPGLRRVETNRQL